MVERAQIDPAARIAPAPQTEARDTLDTLERLAHRMDNAIRLPVIGVRVGLDSILGLVPGIGDLLSLAPAAYIWNEGRRAGAARGTLVRMAGNIGIDTVIGSIPLLGDVFDIGWKANSRNVTLLRQDLERKKARTKARAIFGRDS